MSVHDDVEAFDDYLASLGVTLWQSWDVTDPKRRRQAAAWFVSEVDRFDDWYRENRPASLEVEP